MCLCAGVLFYVVMVLLVAALLLGAVIVVGESTMAQKMRLSARN